MQNEKKTSIRKRFVIPLLIALIPFFIASNLFISYLIESLYFDSLGKDVRNKAEQLYLDIDRYADKAMGISIAMSSISGIEDAYDTADEKAGRDKLRRLIMPVYKNYLKQFNISKMDIHYHKPPARSFLRTWIKKDSKKEGGDDLSSFRATVLSVSKNKKALKGIEAGRGGLEIRAIVPVMSGRRLLGSVEMKYDLNELQNHVSGSERLDFLVYRSSQKLIDSDISKKKVKIEVGAYSSSREIDIKSLNEELLNDEINQIHVEHITNYMTAYVPVKDYSGKFTGVMLYTRDITDEEGKITSIRATLSLIMLGTLIGIIIFIIAVAGRIQKTAQELSESMRQIAGGEADLRVQLDIKEKDEMGELSSGFNIFVSKIRDIISDVLGISHELTSGASGLANANQTFSMNIQNQTAALEEVTSSIEEISAGMDSVVSNAGTQMDETNELFNNIESQSRVIADIDTKMGNSASVMQNLTGEARKGEENLGNMNNTMTNIRSRFSEMNNIIKIISDISEQINLLSLNAAIESARAGDAGRGFAVVADEISKLADLTAASIKEIDSLIKGNEHEIQAGADGISESATTFRQILNSVSTISEFFNSLELLVNDQNQLNGSVREKISKLKELTQNIEMSMDEQKLAMAEILTAVTSVNELTLENSESSEELMSTSRTIADLSEALNGKVNTFKV